MVKEDLSTLKHGGRENPKEVSKSKIHIDTEVNSVSKNRHTGKTLILFGLSTVLFARQMVISSEDSSLNRSVTPTSIKDPILNLSKIFKSVTISESVLYWISKNNLITEFKVSILNK